MEERQHLIDDMLAIQKMMAENGARINELELKRQDLKERLAALEAKESLLSE